LGGNHPVVVSAATRLGSQADVFGCHFALNHLGQVGASHAQFLNAFTQRGVDPDDVVT
jgi:hypothetical protein